MFSGAVIIAMIFAVALLCCILFLFLFLVGPLRGRSGASDIDGFISFLFLFFFIVVCSLRIWKYLHKCSRYVVVRNGMVFVRYVFEPKRNYSLKLSDMDSFFIREYKYKYDRNGVKSTIDPDSSNLEFIHYQVYLCAKKTNRLWLYVDSYTHGNFNEMVKALQDEGKLKEEKMMISISPNEEKKAWNGGVIYLYNDSNINAEEMGKEKPELDEDSFDDNLDELLKMVEKEHGSDVWDFLENMCLITVTKEMSDQLMELLSVLEVDDQQEILVFFNPFGDFGDSFESGTDIILEHNRERMARLSKNLGVLAGTPQFRKMKRAPEWQKLRDIINKDRRECNIKEL